MPENSLPGDPHWQLRNLGAEHEIEGYTGTASVLTGESFPLFVSTTSSGFRVTAFRLGWYQGTGARKVWSSGPVHGARQKSAAVVQPTNTVVTDWDPVVHIPTDDWPAGAYLLRLDADSGAQRYVPVTVRSASTAGKIVIKSCVQTWQAYNMWGGYDLYKDTAGAYSNRSLVVSLDRPYDSNGADYFLTYERNIVKLAEHLGLNLAYVTSMDIAADPHLLDGASALLSLGHDEYWTPEERANVTAARNAGVNLAFLGRERDVPPHPAAVVRARCRPRGGLLQDLVYRGPAVPQGPDGGHQRLARAAELRPGVLADRHDLRGLPGATPRSWCPARRAGCTPARACRRARASRTWSASSTTG